MTSDGFAAFIAARPNAETVVLRRQVSVSPLAFTDAVVKAVVNPQGVAASGGVSPLSGGVAQERWQVIVPHAALSALGWPVPPRRADTLVLSPALDGGGAYVEGSGRPVNVEAPGARGGLGYWLTVEG